MEQYLERGKEVLKILINNGCEAYMIGEAVYNLIKGSTFDVIDITTNATPEMIKGIFEKAKVEDAKEGSVRLTYMGYVFIIRTFRLEEKFKDNRTPIRLHYSKNLKDELAACDFTINAIAMSYGGKLTDAYNGYMDLKNKNIRTIGSARVRFKENPLRILNAIRLTSELGFKIERKTYAAMRNRAKLLKKIEPQLMEHELRKIFTGKYFKKALKYLVDSNAYKYLKDLKKGLYYLRNNYKRISIDSILACSYVLNKNYSTTWENLSDDASRLKQVVELALKNPRSKYDPYLLLTYGLDITLDSNYINYMLRRSSLKANKIRKQYNTLPLKSFEELSFTKNDYYQLSPFASQYYEILSKNVLERILKKELANDYNSIKQFVINALALYGITVDSNQQKIVSQKEIEKPVYRVEEKQMEPEKPRLRSEEYEVGQITTFEQLQRKVSEVEKTLREKDEKIKNLERQALEYKLDSDVNVIVGQNLEILKDLHYLEKGSEKLLFSRELKEVYKGLIKNVDPKYRALDEKKEGNVTTNESED